MELPIAVQVKPASRVAGDVDEEAERMSPLV